MTLEEIRKVKDKWGKQGVDDSFAIYAALSSAIDISTDLLEALKGLVNHQPTGPNDPHRIEVWERARAAIAKAEGEKG